MRAGAEENFPSPPPKIRFIRSCSAALAPAAMAMAVQSLRADLNLNVLKHSCNCMYP